MLGPKCRHSLTLFRMISPLESMSARRQASPYFQPHRMEIQTTDGNPAISQEVGGTGCTMRARRPSLIPSLQESRAAVGAGKNFCECGFSDRPEGPLGCTGRAGKKSCSYERSPLRMGRFLRDVALRPSTTRVQRLVTCLMVGHGTIHIRISANKGKSHSDR